MKTAVTHMLHLYTKLLGYNCNFNHNSPYTITGKGLGGQLRYFSIFYVLVEFGFRLCPSPGN